jgi:maltose O-acetyltransferase
VPDDTERTERARMLAGELYDASDPELVAERERARRLTRAYGETTETETERRRELLAELFGSIGEGIEIEPPLHCDYGSNVHVGDEFYANVDCVLLDVREITFGDRCLLGPDVHVYAATHPVDAAERATGLESGEPVTVGDDVWIGGRAVVTPGTTVGDGASIAAGAVVVDDVPPDTVVGGNPARVLREP